MDARLFDAVARRLTAERPRRNVIALLAGALSSLLIGGPRPAGAICKRPGQQCDKLRRCCRGARCRNGRCRCRAGLDVCRKRCVNRKYNENHCGTCGHICDPTETCCSGLCIDLQSNIFHCGACGISCLPDGQCVEGACTDL